MSNTDVKKAQKLSIESFIDTLSKHPYIATMVLCMFFLPFCFGGQEYITTNSLLFFGGAVLLLTLCFNVMLNSGGDTPQSIMLFGISAVAVCSSIYLFYKTNSVTYVFFPSVIILAFYGYIFHINKCLNAKTICLLIMSAGIMLRLCYVLYTLSTDRQHDVGYFEWNWGHANYIEYWYNNGLKLPDFDVRTIWQYYHPPFHHMVMAALLKILTICGVEYEKACEALQILPFLYSSLCMIASYKIFKIVKLKGVGLIIATSIVAFHPTFVILAGSFNNDVLCTLFVLLSIVAAFRWYNNKTLLNIVFVALAIGLGMMTKLSAWMVAPPVAFIFLYVFFKDIKNFKKYIPQFLVFALICVPTALWWQVRNLIVFDVPLTFVPNLGETSDQYLGNMSSSTRIFGFTENLDTVFVKFIGMGNATNDYNPLISLFKTATFDEGNNQINDINFPQIAQTGPVLFYVGVLVAIVATLAFLFFMFAKKSQLNIVQRVFFIALYCIYFFSYYTFCFKFAHVCTMNIRYCVPLIVLGAMGMGMLINSIKPDTTAKTIAKYSCVGISVLFCLMSCIVYTQLTLVG